MLISSHPCFNHRAHFKYARVHLPVACKCNIRCGFCERGIGDEKRPGITSKILKPKEAIKELSFVIKKFPVKVVAIAGPGEPLANKETFETMRMIKDRFPQLIRCMATNGFLLPENAENLSSLIHTLTISICAVDPDVGKKIYDYVGINGKRIKGKEAAKLLIKKQLEGLRKAVAFGIKVKINTVLIPEINSDHIIDIAKTVSSLGAELMNIIPLIPAGRFKNTPAPAKKELDKIQDICSQYIKQFRLCKRCRADACGIPGGKDDLLGQACI